MFYSLPWKQISSKYLFFIIQVLETQPEIFRDSSVVKAIIRDHQFWQEVEKFRDVLAPAKRAVKNIEAKSSNMASCFLELVKMAIAIKNLPSSLDTNFKRQCIRIFNKRWEKLDIMTYLLTFFFHPKYRGKLISKFYFICIGNILSIVLTFKNY